MVTITLVSGALLTPAQAHTLNAVGQPLWDPWGLKIIPWFSHLQWLKKLLQCLLIFERLNQCGILTWAMALKFLSYELQHICFPKHFKSCDLKGNSLNPMLIKTLTHWSSFLTLYVMTSNNYQITACTHVQYWASYQLSTVIYLVLGLIWALPECHLLVVLSERFESKVLW